MSSTTPQASPLVVPGAIVAGKYRLERPVGAGDTGSVRATTHATLGQSLAIKFISPDLVKSQEALRRFDVEAKAAVQIRSRHVPQVFDNGLLADGTPYIVMELLHGEPLVKRIERLGTVPLADAVSILTQCCRALARAHALGIVHRDIKPDNIYLAQAEDDEGYVAKVLDFGVAKMAVTMQDAASATRTGALIGTPTYMSPEQARGLTTLDHRTDLYSLGLVAFAMLTGKQAFNATSLGDLLLQICAMPLPSLCAQAPPLPRSMEAWFLKACAREPQDRYPSAQQWSEALVAASGLSTGELAAAARNVRSASSFPAGPLASGTNPAAIAQAQSAPQIAASTTGASILSEAPPGTSRKQGALVAVFAGIMTLAIAITVLGVMARARATASSDATSAGSATAAPMPAAPEIPAATVSDPASAVAADAGAPHAKPSPSAPPAPAPPRAVPAPPSRPAPPVLPPKPAPKPGASDNAVGY